MHLVILETTPDFTDTNHLIILGRKEIITLAMMESLGHLKDDGIVKCCGTTDYTLIQLN